MGILQGLRDRVTDYAVSKGFIKSGDPDRRSGRDYDDDIMGDDDEYYEGEDGDYEPERPEKIIDDESKPFSVIYARASLHGREAYRPSVSPHSAKVTPMTDIGSQNTIYISFPESIDECCSISDYIKASNAVVINLESVKHEMAQRIVDFLSGVVHAFDGEIQNVSNKVFLLVPASVGIAGSIKDEIRSASFLSSMKTASFR